jgi:hypothetical protein
VLKYSEMQNARRAYRCTCLLRLLAALTYYAKEVKLKGA